MEDRILRDLDERSSAVMASLRDFSAWLFSYSVPVVCYFEKNATDYSPRIGALANILPSVVTTQLVSANLPSLGTSLTVVSRLYQSQTPASMAT